MKPYYQDDFATIFHGDNRVILPSLGKFDLLLTDPPYGIDFASQPTFGGRWRGQNRESWDKSVVCDLFNLLAGHSDSFCIWGGNYYQLPCSRGWFVWHKPDAPPSMSHVELAWTNKDQNSKLISHSIAATNGERCGHPTQKPLRVIKWCLTELKACGTVLDPFAGSGTTLRAAKDLNLVSVGIEIDERYCEIAARRLQQEVLTL